MRVFPVTLFLSLFLNLLLIGSTQAQDYWNIKNTSSAELNFAELFDSIQVENQKINLPLPDGGMVPFVFVNASVLPSSLRDKYKLYAYQGVCPLDNKTKATITLHEGKLYASIHFSDKKVNIKPNTNSTDYSVEWVTSEFVEHSCLTEKTEEFVAQSALRTSGVNQTSQIKNYTIAISCTGEYTTYHGGTVAKALAAMVTTLNRVNTIYNADLGINLILNANTDKLIYTNASTDPYNNNSADAILNVSQDIFDKALGSTTYDLGHIFSTGAGGLADLYSVCSSKKASGVTGTNKPIGDFFDVDFVSHEIGHQFGADHTFNGVKLSCAGNIGDARFEIGSGSTIMGYAGICGTDNLQSNSDPYFHIKSIEEIKRFITIGDGKSCGYYSSATNNLPVILNQTLSVYTIPVSTPFYLDGKGSDSDGDVLLYNWEQIDLGSSSELNSPSGNAPLFRSFIPTSTTIRYLPKMSSVLAGTSSKGEIYPTYSRKMNFSFNVRDQKGNVANGVTNLSVSSLAGPFVVLEPSNGRSFVIGQKIDVNWDVASTDKTPVNCKSVMILLATDGLNFKDTLAISTPNDGLESVVLPSVVTTNAKVMVIARDNIFFNVSNGKFIISEPSFPYFNPVITNIESTTCGSRDSIKVNLSANTFSGFSSTINYKITGDLQGVILSSNNSDFEPNEIKTIYIKPNSLDSSIMVKLNFEFTSGSIIHNLTKEFTFYSNTSILGATLVSPKMNAINVSKIPEYKWKGEPSTNFVVSYFQNNALANESSSISANSFKFNELLKSNTTYSWKVTSHNACGSVESEEFFYTTGGDSCFTKAATKLPLTLANGTSTFENILTVTDFGVVTSIEVSNLKGTHEWVSDLSFDLINPNGISVNLFSDVCNGGSGSNFNLNLKDNINLPYVPCPPSSGGSFRPIDSFSPFVGRDLKGDWILRITDYFPNVDKGSLTSWGIKFCVDKASFNKIVNALDYINEENLYYLYPNPTDSKIHLNNRYKGNVIVINILGQAILETTIESSLNVESLKEGNYFLKLDNGQVIKFQKY